MPTARQLIAQTGIQVLGKIASIGFGVAAIAIITRALGLAGYGEYATVMAYLQLFGIAVDLGLNVMAPTMIAETGDLRPETRDPRRESIATSQVSSLKSQVLLSNIFTIRLTAAVVVFVLAAGVALLIPAYSASVRVGIALATFSFLAIVLTQILQTPFQMVMDMRWSAAAEIIGRGLLVAGLAMAAWRGAGLHAMVIATVIGNVAMFVIAYTAARRIIPIRLAFDFAVWRRILIRSWPIGLSILFNLVYLRADAVILSFVKSAEDVGIYSAPYRLLDVLTQLPHMVMGLVLPMLAAAWAAGDRLRFADRIQRTFDGLALLGFPIVAGSLVLGTPIMTLVAGQEFAVSGPVLGLLSFALIGIFLGQPFGYGVVAVGAQRRMLWGYAVVAAVTLAGYLLLIPRFSYWGAAWMTVASEVAIAVWTFAVVRAASGLRLSLRIASAAFVASAIMGAALWFLPLPIIPRIGLGAIVYGIILLVFSPTRVMLRTALART